MSLCLSAEDLNLCNIDLITDRNIFRTGLVYPLCIGLQERLVGELVQATMCNGR